MGKNTIKGGKKGEEHTKGWQKGARVHEGMGTRGKSTLRGGEGRQEHTKGWQKGTRTH